MTAVSLGAGRTGRNIDALFLQTADEPLRTNPGHCQRDDVGGFVRPQHHRLRNILFQPRKAVPLQFFHIPQLFRQVFHGFLTGSAKSADHGDVLCAGAHILLLTATIHKWRQMEIFVHIYRAAALGTLNFVGGHGDDVRSQRGCPEWNFQKALHRIGMEHRTRSHVGQFGKTGNVVDGTGFVIHHHNRHQNGVLPQGGKKLLPGNCAVLPGDKVCDLKALRFQMLDGI